MTKSAYTQGIKEFNFKPRIRDIIVYIELGILNDSFITIACARSGLCQAVLYVLKAKPNALAFGGPPCSSFVWLNVATSKRSKSRPLGDVARDYIRLANKLLECI